MRKVKIGVLGAGRGHIMMDYCRKADNAELVAVCDSYRPLLEQNRHEGVTYYDNFEDFIKHDMDAVVLANYAHEHAPFAIRCMEAGKHVMSEVLPFQNMKEGVELVEAVERTGMIYAYGENCCYMPAPREMRRLMQAGKLGTFEYAEGEYMHNCEPIWADITRGDPDHWRNNISAEFYCTHSIGPMIHIAGQRPVKVSGFELPFNARMARMGAKAGAVGLQIITLESGAVLKSVCGLGPSRYSIWYSVYGSLGRVESGREDTGLGVGVVYASLDNYEGENALHREVRYNPYDELSDRARGEAHGGADFYTMYFFCEKVLGHEAEIIDVYEACDMFLPGLFAYRSVLAGGQPMDIPDMRDPVQREKWRNDTACTDPKAAGDMLQPSYSKGNPEIPDEVYAYWRKKFEESQK